MSWELFFALSSVSVLMCAILAYVVTKQIASSLRDGVPRWTAPLLSCCVLIAAFHLIQIITVVLGKAPTSVVGYVELIIVAGHLVALPLLLENRGRSWR